MVHNDILFAVDRGCVVVLVMLDLTAAFETIDHAFLLSLLFHRFRVTGAALEWFRSYLSGRPQVVRIGNEKSPTKDVTFGVPQGSVLGPLLFTAYITPVGDIIKTFSLDYLLYADDTQLYVPFAPGGNSQLNTTDRVYSCFRDIGEWSRTSLLKLNDHNTDVIVFGTKKKLPTLNDFRITVGDTTKNPFIECSQPWRCI